MLAQLINKVRTLFSKMQVARAKNKARTAKLENLFKVGNLILNKSNGQVYRVELTAFGAAMLRAPCGTLRMVSWLTPACTTRLAVADNWDVVC